MLNFEITRLPIICVFLAIVAAHWWATVSSAYFFYWWLDIAMHFAGGFLVGMAALYLFNDKITDPLITFWLVLGTVMLVGVFWEFLEFFATNFLTGWSREVFFQPSLEDTLADLLADLIGGLVSLFLFKINRKTV